MEFVYPQSELFFVIACFEVLPENEKPSSMSNPITAEAHGSLCLVSSDVWRRVDLTRFRHSNAAASSGPCRTRRRELERKAMRRKGEAPQINCFVYNQSSPLACLFSPRLTLAFFFSAFHLGGVESKGHTTFGKNRRMFTPPCVCVWWDGYYGGHLA